MIRVRTGIENSHVVADSHLDLRSENVNNGGKFRVFDQDRLYKKMKRLGVQ